MSSPATRSLALIFCALLCAPMLARAEAPLTDPASLLTGAHAEVVAAQLTLAAGRAAGNLARHNAQTQAATSAHAALAATRDALGLPAHVPDVPSYAELLAMYADPVAASSVGTTSEGRLQRAAELPVSGRHHYIVARSIPRDVRYGSPALVALIEDAAARVAAEYPGSKLGVGNLSRRTGGDIPWSKSHNSGRDADLVFFTRERATGRAAITPDLFSFADDGSNAVEPGLVFDVPRNWALVRALLTSDRAQVQYLFISEGLKAQLLAYARERGEPAWLIERASKVLHQPNDALPHDDHFHLRVYCEQLDRLLGCMESGPRWAWVDHHDGAFFAWTTRMIEAMQDADPATRRRAMEYLIAIKAPHAAEALLWVGAHDEDPALRALALDGAAGAWPWSGSALAAAQALIRRADRAPDERRAAYNILRRSHDAGQIAFLLSRVDDPALSEEERVWAARGLEHLMEPALVPALVERLTMEPARARAELARVLRRIANRADGMDWLRADAAALAAGQQAWRDWWEGARGAPREVWVMAGLIDAGVVRGQALSLDHVEVLISHLPGAPDHLLYNLNRTLREVTGLWAPLDQLNARKLEAYWRELWKKRRERVLSRG
jgi:penicillin-insensitive murein endopeptidase